MRLIKPKWELGDKIGRFTVVAKPERVTTQSKRKEKQWEYTLRCDCGRFERIRQQQLVAGRVDCLECLNKRLRPSTRGELVKPGALPDGIPDFARMKL